MYIRIAYEHAAARQIEQEKSVLMLMAWIIVRIPQVEKENQDLQPKMDISA